MTEDGNSYERQSALKASNGLVCSMINAGLLKPENIEDAFRVEESYYKRILERITEGIDTATGTQKGFSNTTPSSSDKEDTPSDTGSSSNTGDSGYNQCTEKQAKAVFVITHDKVGKRWERNKKFIELESYGIVNKNDIENMKYEDASEFIKKFGGDAYGR